MRNKKKLHTYIHIHIHIYIYMVVLYSLQSMPYYDSVRQEYGNILTINKPATGPLESITKQLRLNKLSPFETNNNLCPRPSCVIGITKIDCRCELMCIDDLPNLFEFLLNNGYTIDNSVTKILQKSNMNTHGNLICMIQY
jgi:hypothetical protein